MRKINLITSICSILFLVKTYGQEPLKTVNPNDQFILLEDMSDEFNTGNINWSKKWEQTNNLPNIAAWNLTNTANVAEGNYFNRGAAKITARYNGKNNNGTSIAINGKFYNAGCLQSQKSLPANFEGYIEATIRGADIDNSDPHPFNEGIDRARGLCPAFWLYSKFFDRNPAKGGVVYTEIDIQELQQHDFHDNVQDEVEDTESNLHIAFKDGNKRRWVRPKKNPEEQLNKYELGFDPRKDWHTYGCEITKEEINFFVDGKKVGKTLKNTHWSKLPLRVIMSLGMRVPFVDFGGNAFTSFDPQGNYPNNDRLKNLAERARRQLGELPESMYVDYVRVWKKGDTIDEPSCSIDTDLEGVKVTEKTKTSLTVEFDEISGVDTYELRAWRKGDFSGSINMPKAFAFEGGKSSPLTIDGLESGQEYTLVLRGVCIAGESTKLSEINATTIADITSCNTEAIITNVEATDKTKTSITIAFDELSGVDMYELRAWEKGDFSGSISTPKAFSFKGGNSSPLTIENLNAGQEYTLVLRGVCSVGKSTKLSEINATTIADVNKCSVDESISGLKAIDKTKTSITIAFDELSGVDMYELRAWEKGDFSGSINTPKAFSFKGGNTSPLTIENLDSGKEYTLVLRGVCSAGKSTKLSEINARTIADVTKCSVDASISGLQAVTNTESSITLAFDELSGVDMYELRAWKKGDFTGSINMPKAFAFKGGDSSPLTILNLDADEEYTLALRAICKVGKSTKISTINSSTQTLMSRVSIRSVRNKKEVRIFPNPIKENRFSLILKDNTASEINVFDIQGKKVFQRYYNTSTIELNKNDFGKSGLYFIQIKQGETTTIKKVILL
ncbi:fibronectin type III domain-containing protein [Tenacibaculum sp. M341]|uniref:fibronectin type III domain-containing protein n=1 Tax=Tenacibaculum sp. M341 TaxID=2530339 RepID=UPI001042ABA4|nr:T9SS type A sorting domain-containing protein [Tenacibaculum sp. M341]TCI84412.1 T9SS type A sorting domain-containing protein [Tenacibaculum sp. M341]